MFERSQSFDIRDKNYTDIQKIMETILEKSLSLSTNTITLGRSLIRINYFDKNLDKEEQKDNRITILQEAEKRVYVQIKGKLKDSQIRQLWIELDKKLNNSSSYETEIVKLKPSKDDIIQDIKGLIELKGYIVKDEEVQRFIDNFIEEYNRLPEENEYHSIVKGYMIIVNEDYLLDKYKTPIKNETTSKSNESVLDIIADEKSSNSYTNSVSVPETSGGRKKCPSCGNDGLIHEVDDKTVILMDYPKIYAKKNICPKCGYEWR
ncbi:MAG: hypothetical protein ACFFDH_22120 [Promethearchaeota archaeon]